MGKNAENQKAELESAKEGTFGLSTGRKTDGLTLVREGEVLRLTFLGYTVKEISKEMGIAERTVFRLLRTPHVLAEVRRREKDLRAAAFRRVKLQSEELIGVIIGIAKGETGDEKAADRLRAAESALDRIGIQKANVNIDVQVGPALTTGELLKRAEALAAELRQLDSERSSEAVALEADTQFIDVGEVQSVDGRDE